jgi:methylmalonyl-CoA mutase N-terminal domain/subunit
MPRWNAVSVSGYHIREAGSTATQELAFTLADGMAYVEASIKAGLKVDEFAPRLSFFFDSHIDFFEEIAKFRAARRIWARIMRDKYGARDPKSWMLRFHTQTAGVSLTRQQVENNVTRTAYEAMAAVLGGTNSLHTNSMDEVLALPTEKAAQIALRTQQVLAHETGVTNTIDPLGGSYFIEQLTDEMERGAQLYFDQIDGQGGVLRCIENGFFQREIADAAFEFERKLEANERIIVGVNAYKEGEGGDVPTLRIGPETEQGQVRRLKALKARRDNTSVTHRLEELKTAARGSDNLMPPLLDCVKAYVTEGEIMAALKEVFGVYREPILF